MSLKGFYHWSENQKKRGGERRKTRFRAITVTHMISMSADGTRLSDVKSTGEMVFASKAAVVLKDQGGIRLS